MLDQLSYECYLTDQVARALSSGLEALGVYEQEQDALSTGTSQRWLSRLSWVLGQNADSERYAAAAVATLEPLGPSHELAMAYSNLAQLRMLADDATEAVRWGTKAIELARSLGDREAEMHALNNVGTALVLSGNLLEGRARLTQSLDLALADDAHEHAARAYTNLGSSTVMRRSFRQADQHLRAGIAYCTDRDLDTWRLYMSAWLARSLAEQGQYPAAEEYLADIMRHPHLSPITQVSALPVAGVLAARRGSDGTRQLDEALRLAAQTGEPQRLVPVASARAEAAWLAGRTSDVAAEIDRAWPAAVVHPQPWDLGELCWWLHLAGEYRPTPAPVARPFALMLAGQHRTAAAAWQDLGCPLWAAYALAFSPKTEDAQECLGHSRRSRRLSRAPRRAARPARPGPDGAPRPPAREPGQPGRAHGARGGGARPARRRAVLRRGRRAAHPVGKDGGPSCLGHAAQAQRADPLAGGRHGPAPGYHPAKIGNLPDAPPGPAQVSCSGRQQACMTSQEGTTHGAVHGHPYDRRPGHHR